MGLEIREAPEQVGVRREPVEPDRGPGRERDGHADDHCQREGASRRVASTQTNIGQRSSFAETDKPSATALGHTAFLYRHITASANASGMDRFESRTALMAGTHRSAAA